MGLEQIITVNSNPAVRMTVQERMGVDVWVIIFKKTLFFYKHSRNISHEV